MVNSTEKKIKWDKDVEGERWETQSFGVRPFRGPMGGAGHATYGQWVELAGWP